MANGVFTRDVLRIHLSDHDQATNTASLDAKDSFPETQGIPRHGCGDLLEDVFSGMMKFEGFHVFGTIHTAKGTSHVLRGPR